MSLEETIKEKEREAKNVNKQLSEAMASFKFVIDGMSLEPSMADVAKMLSMADGIKQISQRKSMLQFIIADLKRNKRKSKKSIDKKKRKR